MEKDNLIEDWLAQETSQEERDELERIIRMTENLSVPEITSKENAWDKLVSNIEEQPSAQERVMIPQKTKPSTWLIWTSSVAAALVIGYFTLFNNVNSEVTFNTLTAEMATQVLPDNSEVTLNAGTTLSYDQDSWSEARSLSLDGEAFFEVQEGTTFTVNTSNGSVTVLGTSFNVRTRGEKLEVFCYTGKVNVSSSNASKDLLPGDGVRIERGSVTSTWKKANVEEPNWMNGVTLFDTPVPLAEAIEELSNIFGIEVLDERYPDSLDFQGPIPHSNVENAIKLVLNTSDNILRYEYDPENNTLKVLSIDQ